MTGAQWREAAIVGSGVLAAVGGALLSAGSWGDVLTPQGIGGLVVSAAGALVSWVARSPRQGGER